MNHGVVGSKVPRTTNRIKKWSNIVAKVIEKQLDILDIAKGGGFGVGPDGKLNLPARTTEETQATADLLAASASKIVRGIEIGQEDRLSLALTGAGPIWAYLAIAHALHGRAGICPKEE